MKTAFLHRHACKQRKGCTGQENWQASYSNLPCRLFHFCPVFINSFMHRFLCKPDEPGPAEVRYSVLAFFGSPELVGIHQHAADGFQGIPAGRFGGQGGIQRRTA